MVTERPARRWPPQRKLSALDRKLIRDLWGSRGQALAIALVIAAGIAVFASMFSTFDSLDLTLRTYYERTRFGDAFVSLKRAPLSRASEIAAIPGVAQVEPRVVVDVTLDVRGLSEPAIGRLISVPAVRRPILCDIVLRKGRYIEAGHPDEVLASEDFAIAHRLEPGDSIGAIINGRRRELQIVGLALSPEYIYPIRPGELLPDERHFGIFWMESRALSAAFDMEGAFNDAVMTFMHGASEPEVIARVDRLLEADAGGLGAIPRSLQSSNWYLSNELAQLRTSGALVPAIFLAVAAFLLNVVLSRLVLIQRPQIAALKALGYGNGAIASHYVKWSIVVASGGAVLGLLSGAYFGWAMTRMYTLFFHFPMLLYRLDPLVVIGSVAIAVVAAVLGAAGAVQRAVSLPPAEAMRPEVPVRFSETWIERAGLKRLLSQPARIIFRTLQRHPGRALLSVFGIALAASLLVVGRFSPDAVDEMLNVQFNLAQRYDVMVSTVEPASPAALDEFRRLPGVMDVEPFRAVPVRLRVGQRSRRTAILGVAAGARLNRVVGASHQALDLPPQGLVLSTELASLIGAGRGDLVTVEVLEGIRPVKAVPIADLVDEYMGTNAYMDLDALHRLMEEGATLSGAYLLVDGSLVDALYRQLKATPHVGGVLLKRAAVESFKGTYQQMLAAMEGVFVLFASVIAFGVVYNTARISLSERSRELATLRVIGFTRAEISYILLGELVLVTLAAIPLGLVMGRWFSAAIAVASDSEMFRIPVVIEPPTYAYAAVVIIVATAISALIVRRRLDHLDLVEVLKTRE
jgi:putative ABC transport system permease protein